MRKTILILLSIVFLSIAILPQSAGSAQNSYDKNLLSADKAKGEEISKKISSLQVLAPLAPVALSPFFGIACLSGTSMLCSHGILPKNDFLMGNKALNNGMVFVVFLALAVATSLPKMTAVSKGFAQAADQLETYAGIISYIAIFYLAGSGSDAGTTASTQQVVYTAGIFSFTKGTLLMIASAVNIIVINTVKYFFEMLVWISPIPALDAIFEAANKAFAAALMAVYAFSPYLALMLNIILFLICLVIFNWARRNMKYYRAILVAPVVAKLFGRSASTPPPHIKVKLAMAVEDGAAILKVFPAGRIHKIKKKDMCWLTSGKDGLFLVKLRLIRAPKVEKLDTANSQINITKNLLSNTIVISSPQMKKPEMLVFSKIYNQQIDTIAAALRPFGTVRTEAAAQDNTAPGTVQPGLA
jgi:hypothetical protein